MTIARSLTTALLLAAAAPLAAQDVQPPAGWRVATDHGAPGDSLWFVEMPPGWHVTTGPGAALYDPAVTAAGAFTVETEAFRFAGETADGHGLFFGGRGLDGDAPDYFAFLIDRDGRYRLYHRAGDDIHEIVPWTAHPAIAAGSADPAADNAKNVQTATVTADSVAFAVNGERVDAFARPPYFDTSGQVGLRVEPGVDVHYVRLDVTPLAGEK
ncbi:MAG TPA: hypothetical protein VM778_14020 [Gemmatimonadota bacterium]|nr:hypothetical protein [Gemmatimonadota bacterium]